MATALAQHLPSLFGPSRRAAWRLSLARRGLAVTAILVALHLVASAAGPPPATAPTLPVRSGPELSVPLALPVDGLVAGERVSLYVPGESTPVATGARVSSTSEAPSGALVARITVRDREIGPILRNMASADGSGSGFVLVARR